MNKHTIISIFLLLLVCGSAAAAGKGSDKTIDESGKSALDMLKWVYDALAEIFWIAVPIGLMFGAILMVFGGSSMSASGQRRIQNAILAVGALYVGLWIVSSIKGL